MDNDESSSDYLAGEFLINICQILCFPFGIDANEELISKTFTIIKDYNFLNKIISACVSCDRNFIEFDIPIGLLARLILSDEDLSQLFIDQINTSNQAS